MKKYIVCLAIFSSINVLASSSSNQNIGFCDKFAWNFNKTVCEGRYFGKAIINPDDLPEEKENIKMQSLKTATLRMLEAARKACSDIDIEEYMLTEITKNSYVSAFRDDRFNEYLVFARAKVLLDCKL